MAQSLNLFQRNHVWLGKWPNGCPTQCRNVPVASERTTEIARECPHIGAFAAFGLEGCMVQIRHFDQRQTIDIHHPRLQLEFLAIARDIVGALAFDLYGGKSRRYLLNSPNES